MFVCLLFVVHKLNLKCCSRRHHPRISARHSRQWRANHASLYHFHSISLILTQQSPGWCFLFFSGSQGHFNGSSSRGRRCYRAMMSGMIPCSRCIRKDLHVEFQIKVKFSNRYQMLLKSGSQLYRPGFISQLIWACTVLGLCTCTVSHIITYSGRVFLSCH